MSTVSTPAHTVETMADFLEQLGGISPERVLIRPSPGTATEQDLLDLLDAADKRLCELIDGTLVEKAVGLRESALTVYLLRILDLFIRERNLGLLTGSDGPLRLFRGRIRMPDIAFLSWDRLPGRRFPNVPIGDFIPDLAVEVLSKSNTPGEMSRKRQDYFKAGVRLVWDIDPDTREVEVFTAPEVSKLLRIDDILDGGDVLPGFTLPLRELFSELDRHG